MHILCPTTWKDAIIIKPKNNIFSYENLRNKHFAREAIYIFFSLLSPVLQHTFCFYEFELAGIQGWKNLEIVKNIYIPFII